MRILADEQFNELTEHIKQLEAENKYLKKLLDDAGIPYDGTDKVPEKNEPNVVSIKEEPITRELVQFFYSMFKGRKDVYSLRSGKPNAKTGKHGYYTQCDNFWQYGLCGKRDGKNATCQTCPNQKYKPLTGEIIYAHLMGEKEDCSDVVGLYPVWLDGTCYYLVFDFDNHDESSDSIKWQEEANALRVICTNNNIPLPICITNVFVHTKESGINWRRMLNKSQMRGFSMTVRHIVMIFEMMLLMLKTKFLSAAHM